MSTSGPPCVSPTYWTGRRAGSGWSRPAALGRKFRLVVSTAATALATLTARARATKNLAEYTETLTTKLTPDFDDLCRHWGVSAEDAWRVLKDIEVEHHPIESLLRTVTMAFKHLYADDPDLMLAELRRFS